MMPMLVMVMVMVMVVLWLLHGSHDQAIATLNNRFHFRVLLWVFDFVFF